MLHYKNYLEIIQEAGDAILALESKRDLHVEDKGGNDPLTEADLKANSILEKLQKEIPGSVFFSEEVKEDVNRLNADYVWIIDPIDGTREYVERIPQYAISVALIYQGKNIFSSVFNPHESLEYQIEGERGFLGNRVETKVGGILTSRSEEKRDLFEKIKPDFDLTAVGSIAYKLSLLAQGRCEGVLSLCPKNEWDIAGGIGLVEASGLLSCDIYGRRFLWNQVKKPLGVLAGKSRYVRSILAKYDLKSMFENDRD